MATAYRSKRQPRTPTRAIGPRWSKAPLEHGDVDGKTEQAHQPQESQRAIRDFLKNEANHTLASLTAMAQPALVAAGVMVRFGLTGASMTVEGAGSMGQTGCYPPAAPFGIAGRGIARVDGLREAYRTACRMTRRRT